MCKVVPALATGNTMVHKSSEVTPFTAHIIAEILHAAGVPKGVYNLVDGVGREVGAAISAHRDIDMVSFTGSTAAGIDVAKRAADNVKRVHQELGGKSPNIGRVEHLAELEPAQLRRLPFAVVDFDPGPSISSVRVDARAGCYAAAKHLIEHGHRRFGILSFLRSSGSARVHPPGQRLTPQAAGTPTDQEKFHGYADALSEAGLDVNDVPMVQADPWDRDAARVMLDAAPNATAILSMSVMQAIAVINEARRRGLSVPRDLSVVGYNDIPDAERSAPPLTTVDGLGVQKGRTAARIVFEGGPPRHEILKPRLIMRASTGPAPVR